LAHKYQNIAVLEYVYILSGKHVLQTNGILVILNLTNNQLI
jgi:hypothetical protein